MFPNQTPEFIFASEIRRNFGIFSLGISRENFVSDLDFYLFSFCNLLTNQDLMG